MCNSVEIWESVLAWKGEIGFTHAEPNEDLGFGLTELTTATNNGDLKRAITFLEAIEMSGETSNIGENANEFISVKGSGRTGRAVRKSEQRLRIYDNK